MIEKVKLFKKKFFYFKNIIANTILVIYMLYMQKNSLFIYIFIKIWVIEKIELCIICSI